MIRVRHYTRVSSMKKILEKAVIRARDQNKVFVELASSRKLSPADAEQKYDLDWGKANAYVEFDVEPELLMSRYNTRLKHDEYFIVGNVETKDRDIEAFFNHPGARRWKPKS